MQTLEQTGQTLTQAEVNVCTKPTRPAKLTVAEALNKLFEESPLNRQDPDLTFHDFLSDLKKSIDSATVFLRNLADDIEFIRQCDIEIAPLNLELHRVACETIQERYASAYQNFKHAVKNKVRAISNINQNGTKELSEIHAEGDRCSFDYITGFNKHDTITFISWSYKSCEDFTRKIPGWVQTNINYLLEKANFDYKPLILDGYLANKTSHVIPVPRLDPALTIDFGDILENPRRVVSFWEE